jgi:hypothetical protein
MYRLLLLCHTFLCFFRYLYRFANASAVRAIKSVARDNNEPAIDEEELAKVLAEVTNFGPSNFQ